MSGAVGVRQEILRKLRRDLVGPSPAPEDADLQREEFDGTVPSRWYLTGFLAPQDELQVSDTAAGNAAATDDERDTDADDHADLFDPGTSEGGAARPEDDPPADGPTAPRRYQPSSIGLTVLVPAGTDEIEALVTWGDYRTEPPLTADMLVPAEEREEQAGKRPTRPDVRWVRVPRGPAKMRLPLVKGRSKDMIVPDSAPPSGGGGALVLTTHVREYDIEQPDGSKEGCARSRCS